jgi:hypothetical protein
MLGQVKGPQLLLSYIAAAWLDVTRRSGWLVVAGGKVAVQLPPCVIAKGVPLHAALCHH